MHNVEQFQKEKDAVRQRQKETQWRMREDLLKQMNEHKAAKQEERNQDMHFFDVIRKQKQEVQAEEEARKQVL